jgi:hypothetical protein
VLFLEREAAEAMISEVREDEPMLADGVPVEAIELEKPTKGEKAVLIYGPRGEPLTKVRLRGGVAAPEVFAPPWPR